MSTKLHLIENDQGKGSVVLIDTSSKPIYALNAERTSSGVYQLDDALTSSIILDGFYTKRLSREELTLPYRRRGRNIEVIAPKIYTLPSFKDISFSVVTFKGTGALPEFIPEKKYVIDPLFWRSETLNSCGRIWGGIDKERACYEAQNKVLSLRGIFHTPYVAQNKIPTTIQNRIYTHSRFWTKKEKEIIVDLYQIVRLSMTNIRYDEFMAFDKKTLAQFANFFTQSGWTVDAWARHLGTVDAVVVKESLRLEKKKKFLNFTPKGIMDDNRFISGEITDLEQVAVSSYATERNYWPWPLAIMGQSKDVINRIAQRLNQSAQEYIEIYFNTLSEKSCFLFTAGQKDNHPLSQNHVSEYLKYQSQMHRK